MNTENSKTSEPQRFKLDLTGKLNFKNPNKNMTLANLSIYYLLFIIIYYLLFIYHLLFIYYLFTLGKTSSLNTTTINLKFLHQLGIILLIYQIVLTQFLTFKVISNLSSKNTNL